MGSDNRRTIRLEPAPLKSDTLGLCSSSPGRGRRNAKLVTKILGANVFTQPWGRSALMDEGDVCTWTLKKIWQCCNLNCQRNNKLESAALNNVNFKAYCLSAIKRLDGKTGQLHFFHENEFSTGTFAIRNGLESLLTYISSFSISLRMNELLPSC